MDKQNAAPTYMEYHSAFERKEILSQARAGANLEEALQDISPSQRGK